MTAFRRAAPLIAAFAFAAVVPAQPPADGVELTVVKWPELDKAIAAQKGTVVVLDVWAEY